MSKRLSTSIVILVLAVLAVEGYFLFQAYLGGSKKYTGPMEKIILGAVTNLKPALVWVAENKGYFQENGVEIIFKEYASAPPAFSAMLSEGSLDMIMSAQAPVVFNSFDRHDFSIISAMVSSYNDVFVLARRDHGITKPYDLRGKKIGLTKGTTGQYFLSLFLLGNNIQPSEVDEVNIKTDQLVSSITAGEIDAISSWQPNIYNAQKALGDKSIVFPSRKMYREDFYFVSNQQFLQNHPVAITRFLQALRQAEDFIKKNKKEAIDIVAQRLGLDRAFVASVWDDFQFGLFLDQTIIKTIEDEARWAIENKLTDKTIVPNYLDYISLDALKKVAPEKVLIVK